MKKLAVLFFATTLLHQSLEGRAQIKASDCYEIYTDSIAGQELFGYKHNGAIKIKAKYLLTYTDTFCKMAIVLDKEKGWLADLKNETRNDKDEFVWAIMKSAYVAFHYSLLNDPDLNEAFKRNLQHSFDEHGEQAEELLLSKLDSDQDKEFQAEIIYMLGQVAKKHIPKTLDYARKLAEHQDDYTRGQAIIVLGWIGATEDTDILRKHLLSDNHAKCRAWSASSYMQIWLRDNDEQLKQKAFDAYKKALQNEKDDSVIASILTSIQEIGGTKLGISKQALADLDTEKIDIAKAKAIRYLDKH